jgi:hypothetical protein
MTTSGTSCFLRSLVSGWAENRDFRKNGGGGGGGG